ncbi:TPA: RNA ligase family protein [Streptococcus suis]
MIGEVVSVLERIKGTSSRKSKEEIISEFLDHEMICKVLKFLLNPYIVTGISTQKIEKETGVVLNERLGSLEEALEWLEKHNTGRDYDIEIIRDFINRNANTELERDVLKQLFSKTYKLGATHKTFNKVAGKEIIPSFSVQLAYDFEKVQPDLSDGFTVTTKLDGQRLVAVVSEDGKVVLFSRNGKPQTGLIEVEKSVKDLANNFLLTLANYNKGFVLDGEVLVNDPNIPKDRTCSETISIMSSKSDAKIGLTYHIFDIIPLDDFYAGKSKEWYLTRRATLDFINRLDLLNKDILNVVPVLYSGFDENMIHELLEKVEKQGEEGLMINLDAPYETKRTKNLLKVKSFNTDDLIIKDIFAGEGQFKGLLGGIIVDYYGVDVKVGSGFTLEQRENLTKKDLVGKVAEIKYFSESTNKDNEDVSLRFPVFVRIRDDKTLDDLDI